MPYSPHFIRFQRLLLLWLLGSISFHVHSIATVESVEGASATHNIEELPLDDLRFLREGTNAELDKLANFNLRGGIGTICFRSMPQPDEHSSQWIQIDLDRLYEIDEIVLVPAIWRDNENGYRDDGFPKKFRILAGTAEDLEGELIASIIADDTVLPRIAPLIIACKDVEASWIRIEADHLSKRFHDGQHILQFAEIIAFSGSENVALHQKVTVSSSQRTGTGGAYQKENLVDGFLPYLMDAAKGQKSNPYLSGFNIGENPTLTFDLENPKLLTKLRIHTIEQGDTVPHALQPNFAVPAHLVIEGANQADFSDAAILWNYEPKDLFEIAPIITKRLNPHPYRFVRLKTLKNYLWEGFSNDGTPLTGARFGFAEIEIFTQDQNVAKGILPTSNYDASGDDSDRMLKSLTDGHNIFGEILTFKNWMRQLARRHDLESALPLINQAIEVRIDEQKKMLQLWSWIAAALAALAVFVFLVDRILRQRAIYKIRENIAADLHDELGANLHAISLLGDLAIANKASPEKSHKHIERIRALAKRTSAAAKHCINIFETPGLCDDLVEEMKRCARRITADIDHNLSFEDEDQVKPIKSQKRIHVLLFYKECLVNIIRHSGATRVTTVLTVDSKDLSLSVTDNGYGFPDSSPPPSLKRRARLLGGKVSISNSEPKESQITLKMRL